MYHVITRKADGAVMDCRPETVGIQDVLHYQVIANHGGAADDYEITTSETPVELTDLRGPVEIEAAKWVEVRAERDRLLLEADWRMTRAYSQGESPPSEWATYMQALRDIPETFAADPDAVVWPQPPGE